MDRSIFTCAGLKPILAECAAGLDRQGILRVWKQPPMDKVSFACG